MLPSFLLLLDYYNFLKGNEKISQYKLKDLISEEFEMMGATLERFSSSTSSCLNVLIENWKVVVWIKAYFAGKYSHHGHQTACLILYILLVLNRYGSAKYFYRCCFNCI